MASLAAQILVGGTALPTEKKFQIHIRLVTSTYSNRIIEKYPLRSRQTAPAAEVCSLVPLRSAYTLLHTEEV